MRNRACRRGAVPRSPYPKGHTPAAALPSPHLPRRGAPERVAKHVLHVAAVVAQVLHLELLGQRRARRGRVPRVRVRRMGVHGRVRVLRGRMGVRRRRLVGRQLGVHHGDRERVVPRSGGAGGGEARARARARLGRPGAACVA